MYFCCYRGVRRTSYNTKRVGTACTVTHPLRLSQISILLEYAGTSPWWPVLPGYAAPAYSRPELSWPGKPTEDSTAEVSP